VTEVRLAVPQQHREPLEVLARASDDDFAALSEALAAGTPGQHQHRRSLVAAVTGVTEAITPRDSELLLHALMSMRGAVSNTPRAVDDFAKDIGDSESLNLESPERDRLAARLVVLLDNPNIVRVAKALDLASEQDHLFTNARILTDIRPIFGDEPEQPPEAAVTFHLLRLETTASGRYERVTIAMDNEDLAQLKAAVDRAVVKAESLEGYLSSIGLIQMETGEPE